MFAPNIWLPELFGLINGFVVHTCFNWTLCSHIYFGLCEWFFVSIVVSSVHLWCCALPEQLTWTWFFRSIWCYVEFKPTPTVYLVANGWASKVLCLSSSWTRMSSMTFYYNARPSVPISPAADELCSFIALGGMGSIETLLHTLTLHSPCWVSACLDALNVNGQSCQNYHVIARYPCMSNKWVTWHTRAP